MKILHINSYFLRGLFYKFLYDEQKKMGLDIDVYVPAPRDSVPTGFNYGDYTTISKNHYMFERYLFQLKQYRIYRDIQTKYSVRDYTAVHAHSLFSNGYAAFRLKKEFGIPYVVAVRNTDVNVFFKRMIHLRSLGTEILKNASSVVFLSEPYRTLVLDSYVAPETRLSVRNKSVVIPNGIDDFWLKNLGGPKKRPADGRIRLLHVGDVDQNKNVETTLRAAELLLNEGYDVRLSIAGKVVDRRVFDRVMDHSLVDYVGYMPKEELIELYRESDVFVLPSVTETFGLVYAEAMSQGLPVIYTQGQGFDGHFEPGEVGFRVLASDHRDIAAALKKILHSYDSISERCIRSSARFSWNNVSSSIGLLYEAIGKQHRL